MASINTPGADSGRRALDHDVPLLPYVDFLLCLISFLLITAVWSESARLAADANVPGNNSGTSPDKQEVLHIDMKGDRAFQLNWRAGHTVVDSIEVPRTKVTQAPGEGLEFQELRDVIAKQWELRGAHRAPSDWARDQAVLHTDNSTDFATIAAVIDAVYDTQRQAHWKGTARRIPVFNVTFAVD